jgi:hypothetical protein
MEELTSTEYHHRAFQPERDLPVHLDHLGLHLINFNNESMAMNDVEMGDFPNSKIASKNGDEEIILEATKVIREWRVCRGKLSSTDSSGNDTERINRRGRCGGVDAETLRMQLQQALDSKLTSRMTGNEGDQAAIDLECREIL